MPPQLLEGETLGNKHKYFNFRVQEAVKSEASLSDIVSQYGDSDIEQLFKIEVANRRRDVEYLMHTLKSADMVVVSRAIRGGAWLVLDDQYSHIVEPHFLHDQLLPLMTTRAACRFMLHVRVTLKDERRVETFYKYYEDKDLSKALKWLPHCSAAFIETTVQKHRNDIPPSLLKRLCRKCPSALYNVYRDSKKCSIHVTPFYRAANYILKTDLVKYLDAMETFEYYSWPSFSPKHTALIMKNCPERIINNFVNYIYNIHCPTAAKYMKPGEIQSFLTKIKKHSAHGRIFVYKDVCPFVKRIPKNIRYEFIKKTYIDKIDVEGGNNKRLFVPDDPVYQWYRHVPFDIAFSELNKLIKNEPSTDQRASMLTAMLTAAGRDPDNIYKVLEYYHKKHINEPFNYKKRVVDSVLSDTNILKYNDRTWNMLNEIFHSMEVYMQSDKDVQNYLQAIIVHKIFHKEQVPEIVEQKFNFNTLKKYKTKLSEVERERIFQYLLKNVEDRMNLQNIDTEERLFEFMTTLSDAMYLLFDWNKDLGDYPSVLNKLKMVVELISKKEKKINVEHLYNRKKSWKRYLIEESILISPKDKTLVNILKHNPTLLNRYPREIDAIRCDDAEDLQRLLPKIKIYWPDTLTAEWLEAYQKRIKENKAPRAVVRGLIDLLPHPELLELLRQYAPDSPKIIWSEVDEVALSLRKNFAQLMYRARPQPPPSAITPYAQGDYLQFALPSLNSILYNISPQSTREHLSHILSGPVSLQKHGIRMAFTKLQSDEVKQVFCKIWNTSKNTTIRAVIFKLAFKLLTREKNEAKIEEFWGLLDMFIQNLSSEENEQIYALLCNVEEVPKIVRAKFCMKSYNFLKSLPANLNCGKHVNMLALSTSKLMDTIEPDFVMGILLEFIEHQFAKKVNSSNYSIADVFAAYLLCTDSEEEQNQRYIKVMTPLMNQICASWDEVHNGERVTRKLFDRLIQVLSTLVKEHITLVGDKYVVPIKLCMNIQKELESKLSIESVYDVLTYLKQMTCYLKHYITIKDAVPPPVKDISGEDACYSGGCGDIDSDRYKQIWMKLTPLLAEDFVKLLKQDMEQHFPSIQMLYGKVSRKFFSTMRYNNKDFTFEKEIMKYNDFVPALLLAMKILPDYCYDDEKEKLNDVRRVLAAHPSKEVRMHYYRKYYDNPISPLES